MEVLSGRQSCPAASTVVTIGAYDGVHLGHRAVIAELRRLGSEMGLPTAVITFDRHPATVVRPESAPKLLTDLGQKLELLASTGLDYAMVVTFDEERSEESAEDFVNELVVDRLHAKAVAVGRDFHFGHKRRGNVEMLASMGATLGFEVIGLGLVGEGDAPVSSTRIRRLLQEGDVEEAAALLSRDHEVRGVVGAGDARGGRLLGYPTANLSVPSDILLPADAIYAARFTSSTALLHPAAVYVGGRPTFYGGVGETVLEAFLIDFSGDLYGGEGKVSFVRRLRGDQRFDSPEALSVQMGRDVEAAKIALAT